MKELMKCHLINYSMILSPCKNYLAVSNNFNCVKIVNLSNENEECSLKTNTNYNGNVYHLKNCGQLLLCTTDCYIVAWKWCDIISNLNKKETDTVLFWKEALPQDSDYFGYLQILSMYIDESDMAIYVGASDGAIHSWKILNDQRPRYLTSYKSLNATAMSLCGGKGFSLIAGCSDGSMRFWDNRLEKECMSLNTSATDVARPKIGTSVNVVTTDINSSDWVLCGGEPQLGLWNVRAKKVGIVLDSGDANAVIFDALIRDQVIVAGGNSANLCVWDMSGQLNSEISLSGLNNVYKLLYRDPVTDDGGRLSDFFVCGWGPSVDLYSGVGYRKKSYEC